MASSASTETGHVHHRDLGAAAASPSEDAVPAGLRAQGPRALTDHQLEVSQPPLLHGQGTRSCNLQLMLAERG